MSQDNVRSCREIQVSSKFSFMPGVDPTVAQTGWAITNLDPTTARACNCNGATADIMDNLGQLVDDLKAKGIISA